MAALPLPSDTISLVTVIVLGAAVAYQVSFFKHRRFFNLSLLQILYLIVLPGILFVIINSYVQKIVSLPRSEFAFLPDRLLSNTVQLAMFFTYGGIAIHATTKSLSERGLRFLESEVAQLNRYLHLTFSHNLIYGGAVLITTGLPLLELNHVPIHEYSRWTSPVLRGLGMGLAFILAIYFYNPTKDGYRSRWVDLRLVFAGLWVALAVIVFAVVKTDAPLRHYQILFPALLCLSLVNSLPLFLIFRRSRYWRQLAHLLNLLRP